MNCLYHARLYHARLYPFTNYRTRGFIRHTCEPSVRAGLSDILVRRKITHLKCAPTWFKERPYQLPIMN